MKVAVIGAGWAGLAAAVSAVERGARVTLFEAGRVAGGRARTVAVGDAFSFCDNGQHILIGGYGAVFALLARLGVAVEQVFYRQPLQWWMYDGLRLDLGRDRGLPYGVDLLKMMLTAKEASLSEKWDGLRQMGQLWRWHRQYGALGVDESVGDWLTRHGVGRRWREGFWTPLVLGAMNTPVAQASLRVLANVVADGVWSGREGSDYCVPRVDLGAVLASPALRFLVDNGGRWVSATRVRSVRCEGGRIWVEGEAFDRVIVAVAPYHALSLLPERVAATFQAAWQSWQYHAITTVYLRYANALRLPALLTGLVNGTAQWLVDRSRLNGANEVAAVISCSAHQTVSEWVAQVHADVLRISPHLASPVAAKVMTEKRATVAATSHRVLPDQTDLNRCGLFLAGDYLHSRYPATLEAAVQSGVQAARLAVSGI